ncbi:MAG: PAS domain S-box protein [Gemmatimonadaceae bacterium]|nr:PAS domain S-box protein [Gemmatimonadaceae bacterium]
MALTPRGPSQGFSNPFDRLTTRSLTWGAVVAAAVLAVNVPLTIRNTRQMEENAGWLAHSHEVVNALSNVLVEVRAADVGVLTSAVTRDSLDAAAVELTRQRVIAQLDSLRVLTADNPPQAQRLIAIRDAANARLNRLALFQSAALERGSEAARRLIVARRQTTRTDSLSLAVGAMIAAEQDLLERRARIADATYQQAARSGVFAGMAALVAFLGFVIVLRRELAARHQAATLLSAERERLETTLRSIGDAVITTDPAGNVTAMNTVAEQLTGRDAITSVGQPLDAVFRIPFDPSVSMGEHPVRAVLSGRLSRSALHQVMLRAPDGTERPIDQTAAAIVTSSGQRLGGVLVFRDVSEQRAAQERIRASQQRLQLALRSARMVSFDVPLDGGPISLSENGPEVLGFPEGTVLSSLDAAFELVHSDDLPAVRDTVAQASLTGESFVLVCRVQRATTHDIAWVEVRGEVQQTRDGRQLLTGLILDISDRRIAEQSIRESESRFRSMADSAPVKIWMSDPHGAFTYLNERWYKFAGGSADAADALASPFDRAHPDDRPELERVVRKAHEEHRAYQHELRLKRHDGVYRWVINTATPRFGADGQWLGFIGSIMDIADRKLLEDELRSLARDLSDADRRKDEFLATLAHELRNPLAPLRNGVEILRLAAPSPEILERTRGMMERQLVQLVRLVDDLLDVSRISSGKLELRVEPLTLDTIVSTATESTATHFATRGQRLNITLPKTPVNVRADAARLSQVLANLLDNASKYSPRDTTVELSVDTTPTHAVIAVRDQGQGIPRHLLSRVFELFTQVDRTLERTTGGLGIGLTLVKRLVEMHGGTIVAESEGQGKGSTFTVTLPLVSAAPPQPPSAPLANQPEATSSDSSDADGLSIVICDDNIDAATTLESILKAGGHRVTTVHDGHHAIELARTTRPAAMIIDLGMPVLNGFDTAARIRALKEGRDIVLIALTGWGNEDYRRRAREAGFSHHLVKPVDLVVLNELLGRIMQEHPQPVHTTI